MPEIRYQYKPRLILALLGISLFGAMGWFTVEAAAGNDKGLIVNKLIELSVFEATVFYWFLSLVLLSACLLSLLALKNALTSKAELILTPHSLQVPKNGWSRQVITVPLADIVEMSAQKVYGNQFLHLVHERGKLTINAAMLPHKANFEEVRTFLFERMEALIQASSPKI